MANPPPQDAITYVVVRSGRAWGVMNVNTRTTVTRLSRQDAERIAAICNKIVARGMAVLDETP